jgi:hypothetical protein
MAAAINGKRHRPGFLRLPSPPSLCSYLNSRSSSYTPLCTRSTPTRAPEHQFPQCRHLCFTPQSVKCIAALSFLSPNTIVSSRDACCPGKPSPGSHSAWSTGPRPPEHRPSRRHRRFATPARFLRLQVRPALLRSVRNRPSSFLFPLSFHRRTRDLTGAAVPPPSGAGRRRGTGNPLDSPVTCANASATRRAHSRTFWSNAAGSRAAPANSPPRAAALRRARRRPSPARVLGRGISDGCAKSRTPCFEWPVHRGPVSRAHGAVHGVRTRWQPLDPRSTVRLRRFTLRVPGKFCIRMPVLPPSKILTIRSWFL